MKKFIKWLIVSVAMLSLSIGAIANGPLLGVATVPVTGMPAFITAGYDFGDINIEVSKFNTNFATIASPFGVWATSLLWTPELGSDGFGYRVGPMVLFDYNLFLQYQGFGFIVGASQTFGPIQLFAQFDILPFGIAAAFPVVGVNILFGDLIPDKAI